MQCAQTGATLCVASSRAARQRIRRSARSAGARAREVSASLQPGNGADEGSAGEAPAAPRLAQRLAAALAAATLSFSAADPGLAIDGAKVGSCLLQKCQLQLAQCLTDEKCLENLVCLNTCNDRPDEAACQIRCGDLYADPAVKAFNACAVTTQKCVPQRETKGLYPIPPKDAVLQQFSTTQYMNGRWYIVAGQNPLFDTFPCQVHYFTSTEEGKFFVKINWRVPRANGQFYERSDLQRFVVDPEQPALLLNHGNEVLHYQDDWYIVDAVADKYFFVYYRGSNDAWDGAPRRNDISYGGAVVYAREPTVDPADIPAFKAAAKRVGLKWEDFVITDNACPDAPPLRVTAPTDLDVLADDVRALGTEVKKDFVNLEKEVERAVGSFENELVSFSRGFTVLPDDTTAKPFAKQRKMDPEMRKAGAALDRMQDQMEAEEDGVTLGSIFRWLGFGK